MGNKKQATAAQNNKEKMGKTNKRNDIILRNILNIAKIKPKDKTSEKFAVHSKIGDVKKISQKSKCLEVDKNRNLKR